MARDSRVPQQLCAAVTEAVDSALRSSAAGLAEEIRRRAGPGIDEAEVGQRCSNLLTRLLEQSSVRSQRFEALTLGYLLRVPDGTLGDGLAVRPGELMAPLRTLAEAEAAGLLGSDEQASEVDEMEMEDDITGLIAMPQSVSDGPVPEPTTDEELSKLSARLALAVRKARGLQSEARSLSQELDLARAMQGVVGSETGPALRGMAKEIADVARKVGQLSHEEGERFREDCAQASPKRTTRDQASDDDLTGLLGTPKRLRPVGLLG